MMAVRPSSEPSAQLATHTTDRLESWKEIAVYLNRSVTTVQRWEADEGLPVHRLQHSKAGTVYALKGELDTWYRGRDVNGGGEPTPRPARAVPFPVDARPREPQPATPDARPAGDAEGAPCDRPSRLERAVRSRWSAPRASVAAVVIVLAAAAAGLVISRVPPRDPFVITSLAVLPLEDQSNGPAYFADGFTEELITEISRLARLEKVINRRSVMRYKGSEKPNAEIAGELGVQALLMGSVLRSGDRVRVTAQLVDPRDDRILWAGTFEETLEDVLVLQRELVRSVIAAVDLELMPGAGPGARRVNAAAHDAYLRGLEAFNVYSGDGLASAPELFREAIERDPRFARAHAALAVALMHRAMAGVAASPAADVRAAVQGALALDDGLAEAHAARGQLLAVYDWEWSGADAAHRRAVALDPNSSLVRMAYAHHLGMLGRVEESLAQARQAVALDPASVATQGELAWALHMARRSEESAAAFRRIVQLGDDPIYQLAHWFVDFHEARLGRASAVCARAPETPVCGYASAMAGDRAEAQRILHGSCSQVIREGSMVAGQGLVTDETYQTLCLQLAAILGDPEPMLRYVERLTDARAFICAFFRAPDFSDPLRHEPRFHAVLQRIGLPP